MLRTNASRERGLGTDLLDLITVLMLVESCIISVYISLNLPMDHHFPTAYLCSWWQGGWRERTRLHLVKIHSLHWGKTPEHRGHVHNDDLDRWDGEDGREVQEGQDIFKHAADSFYSRNTIF